MICFRILLVFFSEFSSDHLIILSGFYADSFQDSFQKHLKILYSQIFFFKILRILFSIHSGFFSESSKDFFRNPSQDTFQKPRFVSESSRDSFLNPLRVMLRFILGFFSDPKRIIFVILSGFYSESIQNSCQNPFRTCFRILSRFV